MNDAQIFQILGLVYLPVGLGILINPGFYKKIIDNFSDNPATIYFGGAMAVIVGYLLITFFHNWTWGWSLVITVMGWLALIEGIWFFVFPKAMVYLAKRLGEEWLNVGGLVALVMGFWFLILGFRAF